MENVAFSIQEQIASEVEIVTYNNRFEKPLKPHHAFIGDTIIFERKNRPVVGTVVWYREETVIVEVEAAISLELGIENNVTVVNHKNYEVV
jgi:uncharacterized protein YkvS